MGRREFRDDKDGGEGMGMEGSYLPGLVGMTQTGVEASTGDAAVLNTCGMLLEPGGWVWGTLIEFTWTWVYRQKRQSVNEETFHILMSSFRVRTTKK